MSIILCEGNVKNNSTAYRYSSAWRSILTSACQHVQNIIAKMLKLRGYNVWIFAMPTLAQHVSKLIFAKKPKTQSTAESDRNVHVHKIYDKVKFWPDGGTRLIIRPLTWLQIMKGKTWMSAPNFIAINPAFVSIFVKMFPLVVVSTDTVKKLLPPTRLSSCDHVIYQGRDGTKGATAVIHLAFFLERDYGKFATFTYTILCFHVWLITA